MRFLIVIKLQWFKRGKKIFGFGNWFLWGFLGGYGLSFWFGRFLCFMGDGLILFF